MPSSANDGVSPFSRADDSADPRDALVAILDEMAGMLDASDARIAERLRAVTAALRVAPPGDLHDNLVRTVRRLRQGTMGSLSDVVFGELVDGRWRSDEARDRRFAALSRALRAQAAHLPASKPPDLFLMTDQLRECWLVDPTASRAGAWRVEVQPPLWVDEGSTTELVSLRPRERVDDWNVGAGPDTGMVVDIVWPDRGDHNVAESLSIGRVYRTRAAAEAG